MYEKHPHFNDLPDDTIIWKYLDLFKYLDLISSKTLFMLRADKFIDPFDAKGPDIEYIKDYLAMIGVEDNIDRMADSYLKIYNNIRRCTYVNCWHINEFESSVMWDAYSNANGGLVIKSTVGYLKKCITETKDIYISKVIYDRDAIAMDNVLRGIFHKKREFQDERELRVFFTENIAPNRQEDFYSGLKIFDKIAIDVDLLISDVYFHPLTPDWVASSIQSLIRTYGAKFVPEKSTLYTA